MEQRGLGAARLRSNKGAGLQPMSIAFEASEVWVALLHAKLQPLRPLRWRVET